jgi:CubicO group peptidase (beta-lactamase class C family)
MLKHSARAIALVLLAASPIAAQQRDVGAIADSVFARWTKTTPGCAVGIAQGGNVLLTRGYGMANLETGTPLTAESILESGSVAKQFTAAAVVLLAIDGKLRLDDPVRKYFPELPEYDRPIMIRHLLNHTSGLRDWSNLVAVAGWPRGERAHTQDDLLDFVFRQKSLNYPVGDHYSYTNSGYALLKTLVERVSGKNFQDFTRERLFAPLGMTNTQWRDDFTRIVPGRAQAYGPVQGGGWRLAMPYEHVVGPGGLLTTVGDWLKWNEALAKNTLAPGLTDSLTRRGRLTSGREISYALGLTVGEYRGVKEIAHSGSTGGYSTFLARYPDRDNLSIAVLCNSSSASATGQTRQIADRLIADFPQRVALDTTRFDPATLKRFHGVYRNDLTHGPNIMSAATISRMRALPNGWYYLTPSGSRFQFLPTPSGKQWKVRSVDPDGDTLTYTFLSDTTWMPTRDQLKEFEGRYRTEELGVTYTLRLEGDSLKASVRPGQWVALRPTYKDGFLRGGRAVWFSRDRRGQVTAMHFSEGRMWDLVLTREKTVVAKK